MSQTTSLIVQECGQVQKLRLSPPRDMSSSWSFLDLDILLKSPFSKNSLIPSWMYKIQIIIVVYKTQKLNTLFTSVIICSLQAKHFRVAPPEVLSSPALVIVLYACCVPRHQYFPVKTLQMNTMKASKKSSNSKELLVEMFPYFWHQWRQPACLQGETEYKLFNRQSQIRLNDLGPSIPLIYTSVNLGKFHPI